MPNSLMYQDETHFVVLECNQPEQLLTADELLGKLKVILGDRQDNLPRDLQKFPTIDAQAQYLLETSCEFDLGPGEYFQWYVVRLEK
ncbi:chlororespiratory reduction protein 7 [Laspinema olomoucense]|uniref:Chlororespiratory reduction protein 7 n=1 Tax=Laspinema olomoucense D3b TaxID=2953688 RepID=A0ABT2N946_9CYAN|nr:MULTISPECIES: chlororespiratory reduction protein 7 [unclassified Laspinema]MCT7975152.1 chlororespiratory reduction protein 7 [Laspinema sp. D3d]MCT7979225.1 chlororespiratory reduction protein 7 [Laspinema sp. D3b]MCT7990666.1 chlororespiratory reduction protein 7 [Laspinema sp. D3a]MCT7996698.1 chlororespiratory reduction protein 7 [Laspinema sp. D3c]